MNNPDDKTSGQPSGASEKASPKPYVSPEVLAEAAEDAAQGVASEATQDENAKLAQEVAESRDRLLRTLAEMENLRRRTEREVSDARTYGISGFARDVLDIADNLHRALEAIPQEAREAGDATLKVLVEGVDLTERSLLKALEKHGVKKFDPLNEKFNPNLHQAMYEVPDASVPSGMVVQVMQAGYMIGERVLRPALVGVSKGGPKASDISQVDASNAANDS